MTIELMEENIYSINEFRKLTDYELANLREELSNRINWRFTTEYYDTKKVNILMKNEKKLNKVILEKI